MSLRLNIRTLPLGEMRYPTLGDYYFTPSPRARSWDRPEILHIEVADLGNEDYEFLISIHEQVEEYLTRKRGIKEPDIKAFDELFEDERKAGKWTDEEPGNDPRAPYRSEHQIAESIERQLASHLGVDWEVYEKFCATYDASYAAHMETEG